MGSRSNPYVLAWIGASTLVIGLLAWMVRFEPAAVPVIVVLGCVLAGGVVAGAYCWRRSHRVVGLLGMLVPAFVPVAHLLSILVVLRVDEDEEPGWAPTFVGDALGLAAAVCASTVVVILAPVLVRTGNADGG
jgi:hypothetical protein